MSQPPPLTIFQVDAFTDRPFAGNPAGVCVLAEPLDEDTMRAIAAEMNLSETAFLYPLEGGYHLRWFTPAAEVDLCGHATLASAHILWQQGYLDPTQTAHFQTRSGWLTATQDNDWVTLDFPAQPVEAVMATPELLKGLRGLQPTFIGRNLAQSPNYLVELPSEDHVRMLQPDFSTLEMLPVMGVIVTSAAETADFDFVSRYFAPAIGIDEDPVTGSAHCSLAPYWQTKLGKDALLARQISSRGGTLKLRCQGDRVQLSGQAVTVLEGTLRLSTGA